MSEPGYELQKDILGSKDSTCQGPGTKSAGCVSELWLASGRSEDGADQTQILLGFSQEE